MMFWRACYPSFVGGSTNIFFENNTKQYNSIVGVMPEGLAGSQALFWYDNDKDRKTCYSVIQLI